VYRDNVYREFSIADRADEVAVQSCFDRHSGLVAVQRDEDQRAVTVRVEADGALASCIADEEAQHGASPATSFVSSPASVYFHQRTGDPWAPPKEPALFPPKWYRCTGITPRHVVSIPEMKTVKKAAAACVADDEMQSVNADVGFDGRINKLMFPDADSAQRIDCLRHAICQYRFDEQVPFLEFFVMGPQARAKAAPVLKDPNG